MVEFRSENRFGGNTPLSPRQPARVAVVNGDDFGFSFGVNRAIIEAHQHGILTTTSLMVTGRAFDDAVDLARANTSLAVGLHLVVVCGGSVLSANSIPHLVDRNESFPYSPMLTGLRYQFSGAARRELKLEIRAQLERFMDTGLPLSHVDGHLHMHMHPVVFDILVDLARDFPIRHIRIPREQVSTALNIDRSNALAKIVWGSVFGGLSRRGAAKLLSAGIGFSDRVYGLMSSGKMNEQYVLKLIPRITGRTVEIYFHPSVELEGEPLNGPKGSGRAELYALTSEKIRTLLEGNGFLISTFADAPIKPRIEFGGSESESHPV
jgi:chitin disaccharide deacetylase